MSRWACLFMLIAASHIGFSQTPDTAARQMNEVEVRGYLSRQPLLQTPSSAAVVTESQLQSQATETLLPALNLVPGLRMEERSPGSYRLSLRGSLIRSPFGIRNVKVYLEDFPLTDAGGNTYLNLIDPRSISNAEILKGPDGSLFGANSGGVLLFDLGPDKSRRQLTAELSAGSFGLLHQSLRISQPVAKGHFRLNQGFQRSDGYREHSALQRHFLQAGHEWQYHPHNTLRLFAFFSDLHYQTPGGLTLAQFQADPEQARPASGPNPGAVAQNAGIANHTLFAGLSHQVRLGRRATHRAAFFGSGTDYRNPFITNYETRTERNIGLRTYVQLHSADSLALTWQWTTGLEWQHANQRIRNYDNLGGSRGNPQSADRIQVTQHFYFSRIALQLHRKLTAEAALSANFYRYRFQNLPKWPEAYSGEHDFLPEWMPRLALSYLLHQNVAWRASASRGYSPPTIAEIRPSSQEINTNLQSETGWNFETGLRYSHSGNRFQADASVFNYRLQQAIVRRLTATDEEFFTNAGGTRQTGIEALLSGWLVQAGKPGLLNGLELTASYTYHHFRFSAYQLAGADYSGNRLTGVPGHVLGGGLVVRLLTNFTLSAQMLYSDRIPLNDANTVFSEPSTLLQAKVRWQKETRNNRAWELYAGADNLLNERYSLGHDLNAFGGRYYNAAPLRNFYLGAIFSIW